MASFEYLADGHHFDDANLIARPRADFRDPAERCPLTVLRKASSKRHAVPRCATIRLSQPGRFLQQGEGLADSGESRHLANGRIHRASIEADTAKEQTAWRVAAPLPFSVTVRTNQQGARDGCVTLCVPRSVAVARLPSVREVASRHLLVRKAWLPGNGDTAVRCSSHARRRRSSDGRSRIAKE